LRDGSGSAPLGTIDVRSEGFGVGDPTPGSTQAGGGALTGGTLPAISYSEQSKAWGPVPRTPVADRLDINATNVSTVTINPSRAHVDCDAQLNVRTDGPVTLCLSGCSRTARYTAGNACDASRPPRASISRHGLHASRRGGLRLSGRAIAFRCKGNRALAGKVRRVRISVWRKSGRKCRYVTKSGRLTAPRSCRKPLRMNAKLGRTRKGKTPWSFRLRHMPAGRFEVLASALDSKGHTQRASAKFNHKAFRVR
jgi:hypothetical protein